MVNDIIGAIAVRLNTEFGDGYRIYRDDITQGLKEPCFFIAVLKPSLKPLTGGRYFADNPFDIHYFPKNGGDNGELLSAAGRMPDALEYITLPDGDMLRGTKMSFEIVDGVLHFFINYNMHLIKPTEIVCMETYKSKVGTTKG